LLFLDIRFIFDTAFFDSVSYLQFVPSLINFITKPAFAASGCIVIIIITLLYGRVYCSSICPVGTYQDLLIFAKKILKKKRKRLTFIRPLGFINNPILGATLIMTLLGWMFLLNQLDPYSAWGRISAIFLRDALSGLNNDITKATEFIGSYEVFKVEVHRVRYELMVLPAIYLLLISGMSLWKGRLFCNTVCPVGNVLGQLSKLSLYKIKFSQSQCTDCGLCERECKAGCIDYKNHRLDFDRCISCFNCLNACNAGGFKYERSYLRQKPSQVETNVSKREFMLQLSVLLVGFEDVMRRRKQRRAKRKPLVPENKKYPVTPPGSISRSHYSDRCTACQLCVAACPTQVLQPAFMEYGFDGMFQPRMDNRLSFCNYDCVKCGEVCPTGAIMPQSPDAKKRIQTGKAVLIKDNCVVFAEHKVCGSCSEHCPTKACYMIPYKGITAPELNNDICVGCGACEYACPTKPYKSIYIEGNPVHLKAKMPQSNKVAPGNEIPEEFPF